MRWKTFFVGLVGCGLAAALVLLSRQSPKPTVAVDAGAGVRDVPVESAGPMAAEASTPAIPLEAGLPAAAAAMADDESVDPSEPALEEIQHQLDAGDPVSLRMIAVQLRHPEPEVRRAAREALREASSSARDTVPDIQVAADVATDPREEVELLDLIEYINLPSLSELQASVEFAGPAGPSTHWSRKRKSSLRNPPAEPATQPLPVTGQPTADQLAQLQAENEQLKRENQEMKEMLNRLLPPK